MKICIDAGHGGTDAGCCGIEKNLNLEYAKELKFQLEKFKDVQIVMTRVNDKTLSLTDRANISNNTGCDLFISCHLNAFNSTARGTEVIHSIFAKQPFIEFCKDICVNLSENLKIPYRRVFSRKSSNGNYDYYTVINKTKSPALIIEPLFLDNDLDRQAYNPYTLSEVIALCVKNHFNLSYKDSIKEIDKIYRVVAGSFKDKENALRRQHELKQHGYDTFLDEFDK